MTTRHGPQLDVTDVGLTEVGLTEIGPTETGPLTEVGPTETGPTFMDLAEPTDGTRPLYGAITLGEVTLAASSPTRSNTPTSLGRTVHGP